MKEKYFYEPEYIDQYKLVLLQSGKMEDKKKFINDKFDSLNKLYRSTQPEKVYDYEYITKDYLIDNIEYAFKAWQLPWAKDLGFDEFCEYILPYKVNDEKPTSWRKPLFEQFACYTDSLGKYEDVQKITSAINTQISWFKFQFPFDYPVNLDYNTMLVGKTGTCADATCLTVYALRSVGIAAVVDYTPQWATRNYGHSWNSLRVSPTKFIPFQGTETNPGLTKIEFDPNEDYTFKRAKVYRYTFSRQHLNDPVLKEGGEDVPTNFKNEYYKDVTGDYIPVADISVKANKELNDYKKNNAYVCVFDNLNWTPVDHGTIDGKKIGFRQMGTDIVCIAAVYREQSLFYQSDPFIITKDKTLHYLIPDTLKKERARLYRKYPYNLSNEIKIGDSYRLLYWANDAWVSLGDQTATEKSLYYDNIPANALLLLRNVSRGKQERPFIIRNGQQIFY
jgi:hypothetical protein